MSDLRVEAVTTGHPPVTLLACVRCGVIVWDIDAHYAHSHGCGHPNHGSQTHDVVSDADNQSTAPSDTDREAWDKAFPDAGGGLLGLDNLPSPWDAFVAGRASQPVQVEVTRCPEHARNKNPED